MASALKVSVSLTLFAVACSLAVILAVFFQIDLSSLPQEFQAKSSGSFGLLLCGISNLIMASRKNSLLGVGNALSAAAILMGASTIFEQCTANELQLNQAISQVLNPTASSTELMGPCTAVGLILMGLAQIMWSAKFFRFSYVSNLLVIFGSAIVLNGYVLGLPYITKIGAFAPMGLTIALPFLALGLAFLFALPEYGVVALLNDRGFAGYVFRRLVLISTLAPVALSAFRLMLHVPFQYGLSFMMVITIFSLGSLSYAVAVVCQRRERESRESEERIRKVQKEEEENAKRLELFNQREEFMASLAHDLKSPLIAANRILELMAAKAWGPVSEDQSDLLIQLRDSNKTLLSMISSLLDVYRFERDLDSLEMESVDLCEIVSSCLNNVYAIAVSRRINLLHEMPDNAVVKADALSLRRVFQNVLDNALKFTPDNGKIQLKIEVSSNAVLITIEDTGPGISEADQERLFQRFGKGKSHQAMQGTGLGLYLCKQVVNAHGGKIFYEPALPNGSKFKIQLPLIRTGTATKDSNNVLPLFGVDDRTG